MSELTEQQIEFIEKHLKIPKVVGRKEAKAKKALWTDEFRAFNTHREAIAQRVSALDDASLRSRLLSQLADAEAQVMADAKKPDFDGGRRRLDDINAVVQSTKVVQECDRAVAQVLKDADAVLAGKPDNADELRLMRDFIVERHERGKTNGDTALLRSVLAATQRLADALLAPVPIRLTDGEASKAKAKLQQQADMRAPMAALQAQEARWVTLQATLTAGFADGWPPTLQRQRKAIGDELDVTDADAPAAVQAKADKARGLLDKLDADSKTPLADRAKYEKARQTLLAGRYAVLTAHRQVAHAVVAKALGDVNTKLQQAQAASGTFDDAGALKLVEQAQKDTEAAIARADEVAEYLDVHADRAERMAPVLAVDLSTVTDDEAKDAVKAAKDAWRGIEKAFSGASASRVKARAPDLERLPEQIDRALKLVRYSKSFDDRYQELIDALDEYDADIAGWAQPARNEMQAVTQRARTYLATLSPGGGLGLEARIAGLVKAEVNVDLVDARIEEIAGYYVALRQFKTRETELASHDAEPGHVAAAAYRTRCAADKAHAHARKLQGEYMMGKRVLESASGLHQPALAAIAEANTYFTERKAVEDEAADINGLPGAAAAADSLQAVDELLAQAADAEAEGDWKAAQALVAVADARVGQARTQAEGDDDLRQALDRSAVNAIDTDLAAALAAFDAGHALVQPLVEGDLVPLLQQAQDLRDAAEAAAGETPARIDQARADLNAACDACLEVRQKVEAKAAFEAALDDARALRQALIDEGLNPNDYFNAELGRMQDLIDDAVNDAAAPALDFAGAEALLQQVRPLALKVRTGAPAVVAVNEKFGLLGQNIKALEPAHVAKHIPDGLQRLKDLKDAAEAAYTGNDPALAKSKIEEALALVPGLRELCSRGLGLDEQIKKVLDPALAGLPKTQVYSATERQRIDELRKQLQRASDKGAHSAASGLANQIQEACSRCRALEAGGAAYALALKPIADRLQDLATRLPGAAQHLGGELAQRRAERDAAQTEADRGNFDGAIARLQPLPALLDRLDDSIKAYQAYLDARKAADDAMADLAKLTHHQAVAPLVARLKAERDLAVGLGTAGQIEDARLLLEDLARRSGQALRDAASFAEYAQMAEAAKTGPGDGPDGLDSALRRAQLLVDDLRDHPHAMAAFGQVSQAQARIAEATKLAGTDAKTAADRLAQAMDLCTQARQLLGQYQQLVEFEHSACEPIRQLLATHAHAGYVRDALQARLDGVEQAMDAVRRDPAQHAAAAKAIEDALGDLHQQRTLADQHGQVVAMLDVAAGVAADLERHEQRHAVAPDIAAVQADIQLARRLDEQRKPADALKAVTRARDKARQTQLAMAMQAGKAPSQAELKALLARDDGPETLDKIVQNLDAGVRHKVMNEVFKARFGCEVALYKEGGAFVKNGVEAFKKANPDATKEQIAQKEQELKIQDRSQNYDLLEAEKAPDLRRMYQIMAKLPPRMTLDNDSLKVFTQRKGDAGGSYYSGDKKLICMSEGPPENGGFYGVGLPHELEETQTDPDCRVVAGQRMTYFEWNTLHEVGHAVDDQLGFMQKRGNALAGWIDHGANSRPAAKALAELYDYDQAYLAAYLDGVAEPPRPAVKSGVAAAEWEHRRLNARAHADRMREKVKPWQTAASAKASSVKGQCFQESYPGYWTQYPLDERKRGVSGYQFRAPGEWFAELFACYHSGRMKPSHPAVAWLSTL